MHFTTSFNSDIAKAAGVEEAIVYAWIEYQMFLVESMNDAVLFVDNRFWVRCPREMLLSVFPFWTENQTGRIIENLTEKGLIVQKTGTEKGDRLFSVNEYEPAGKPKKEKKPKVIKETKEYSFYRIEEDGSKTPVTMSKGTIVNELINMFKTVNPSYDSFFARPAERNALDKMVDRYSPSLLFWLMDQIPHTNGMQWAPVITSPREFERLAPKLVAFLKKQQSEGGRKTPASISL